MIAGSPIRTVTADSTFEVSKEGDSMCSILIRRGGALAAIVAALTACQSRISLRS
jgi:hypothetical protein